jgi:hypothetical protein
VSHEHEGDGRPALFKGVFILISTLIGAAMAYAGWIVVIYWDRVGV